MVELYYCELHPEQPLPKGYSWSKLDKRTQSRNVLTPNTETLLVRLSDKADLFSIEDFEIFAEIARDEGKLETW